MSGQNRLIPIDLPPPVVQRSAEAWVAFLAWSVAAVILAGSVFGYEFFHLSLLTIDRTLLAGTVALALLAVWSRRLPCPTWQRLDVGLLLFSGGLAINLALTDWDFRSQKPVAQFLFFYLMPIALYGVVRLIGPHRQTWRVLRGTFIGLGAYLAFIGICEVQGWWGLIFPRFIVNSPETEFLGRGRGPFLNPIACGIFQTVGLACGLTLWKTANSPGRWLLVGYGLLMSVGILTTLTRSVWLAAIPVVAIFCWSQLDRRWRGTTLVVTPLLIGVALLTVGEKLNGFKRDKDVSVEDMSESAQLRPLLAIVARKMIWDRPLLGHGLAQYPKHSKPYHFRAVRNVPLQKVLPYMQHNLFLAYAVETGLVGLDLFLLLVGLFLRQSLSLWLDPQLPGEVQQIGFVAGTVMTTYLLNGLFHDVAIIPMNNMLFYLFAGLVTALFGHFYPSSTVWPAISGADPRGRRPLSTTSATAGRP